MSTIVKLPDAPADVPVQDDRSPTLALLQIDPPEARLDDESDGDLVKVIMVGVGDWLLRRAREYQERYAAACAEWKVWDDMSKDWSEEHDAKHDELTAKYDVCGPLFEDVEFKVAEVEL